MLKSIQSAIKWVTSNIFVLAAVLGLTLYMASSRSDIADIAVGGAMLVRLLHFVIVAVAVMAIVRIAQYARVLFPQKGIDHASTAVSRALLGAGMYIAFAVLAAGIFGSG